MPPPGVLIRPPRPVLVSAMGIDHDAGLDADIITHALRSLSVTAGASVIADRSRLKWELCIKVCETPLCFISSLSLPFHRSYPPLSWVWCLPSPSACSVLRSCWCWSLWTWSRARRSSWPGWRGGWSQKGPLASYFWCPLPASSTEVWMTTRRQFSSLGVVPVCARLSQVTQTHRARLLNSSWLCVCDHQEQIRIFTVNS